MVEAIHSAAGTEWETTSATDLTARTVTDVVAEATRAAARPQIRAEEAFLAAACMASAPTLAKAVDRGSRFYAALARAAGSDSRVSMELRVSARTAELRFFTGGPGVHGRSSFSASLVGAVFHVRLLGWLGGQEIAEASVATSHRQFVDPAQVAGIVPWPLRFSVDLGPGCDVRVTFPSRYLSYPVVRGTRDVEDLDMMSLLFSETTRSSVAMTVRRIMLGALSRGAKLPSAARLAVLCNRSPATLRRHLARESTSVREIREECVRDRALQLLVDRKMTLGEIALRLGFSDAPCFRRAFRRWTGRSPAAYRRGITVSATNEEDVLQ